MSGADKKLGMNSRVLTELHNRNLLYSKMIDEVQDYAIILLNTEGIIQNWNKGAEKIKKYTEAEAVGMSFEMFYLPEDRASKLPQYLLKQASAEGRAIHEGWRLRKDGTKFWGSITLTALHDSIGNVIGFTKVTRDLTERKLAEDKDRILAQQLAESNEFLRKSEEQYHKMIAEVVDYAIILLDVDGTIRNWNAGAQRIKGYSESEIIGKNFRIFYSPEDQADQLPEHLVKTAIEYGKANHEGWRVRKDGTKFWGNIVITSLHGDNNELIGFSKVTRDLTERKKAEDKLNEYLKELEIQNKQLEQFAYVASHDLQEPLRKIRTFVDVVQKNFQNQDLVKKYFQKIDLSAQRMSDQIQGILAYSQITWNTEQTVDTDVNKIISGILIDFELLIAEKKAKIIVGQVPVICADPIQIQQLFYNLLGNALKFSIEDPIIEISSKIVKYKDLRDEVPGIEKRNYLQILVSDNGIGFDDKYQEQIFHLFQRLHPKNEYGGTGIGLALCKKIMENHDGFIKASGKEGEGAKFYLYFPV